MKETPDFEQSFYSSTETGIYKNGHHSIRVMKCLAFHDRFSIWECKLLWSNGEYFKLSKWNIWTIIAM